MKVKQEFSMYIKTPKGNIANVRCTKNVSKKTLTMLSNVVDKLVEPEKIPCHNCQGNGCEVCNGMGYYHL